MRNVSKLALVALVTFTSALTYGQDEKKDVKLSDDQVKAIKAWGDPAALKDDKFTQAKQGQNRTVVATLIKSKAVDTEIHLGSKSGHLGVKDGAEFVATREGGSGLALVQKRTVVWIAYDDTEGFQAPVVIEPVKNLHPTTKALLGWGYAPPTAHTGYMMILPKGK
jgi:hypothetical protein